jgi:hypothetical protein
VKNIKSKIIDNSNLTEFNDIEFEKFLALIKSTAVNFENNYFVIVNNVKHDNLPITLIICDYLENVGLSLVDEIIWLCDTKSNNTFKNTFKSILWFTKKTNYYFNKDILRVKHIWKDMEWGKREGNYHPLGKDPGNVWIKEYSEKAIITEHKFLTTEEIYAKLILSQIKNEKENFEILTNSKTSKKIISEKIQLKSKIEFNLLIKSFS